MRSVEFAPEAFEDFTWWSINQPKASLRILRMVGEAQRTPFSGIGKSEPLKGEQRGAWSRRISDEHRLTYVVSDERNRVLTCRHHYGR